MATTSAKEHPIGRSAPGVARRLPRISARWKWLAGFVLLFMAVELIVSFSLSDRLRRQMEASINGNLKGYTARIERVDFDILGFAITLLGVTVVQDARPRPPVADIESMGASVHWRALLHGSLVADFAIERPRVHFDARQMQAEANDKVDVEDKGWQEAVESIYPLEINLFEINDGSITYVEDPKRPIKVEQLTIVAENIRNVRSPDRVYPSNLYASAEVFDSGRLRIDGHANFMAEPYAGVDVDFDLRKLKIDAIDPLAKHANIRIKEGTLAANGHVEYAPKKKDIRLKQARIDGIQVEYVHTAATASAEERRVEKVKDAAADVSNEPAMTVRVDEVAIRDSTLAYRDADRFRVFFSDTDITVKDVSSHAEPDPAKIEASGKFMGAGATSIKATVRPVNKTPEFDLALQIEKTPLQKMNDLFRTYGQFDVAGGTFSLYTELRAENGRLRGYVKPLFENMDVYDRRQDKSKSLFREIYEAIIGGVASLLENRQDKVATKASVSGEIDAPNVSTWQVVVRLLQNAFIRAILPGLEEQLGRVGAERSDS